jgi:predicted Zn-dependent protease
MNSVTSLRRLRLAVCSFVLCLFFIFICLLVDAQTNGFLPATEDSKLLISLSEKYRQCYRGELDKLPSKNKKDFQEAYTQRWNNIKEKFDKQEIYTSTYAQEYLDGLVAEIQKANPLLRDHPFNCYFSRSGIPNASYIGEGIIVFNMGLFQRLDNESQAAFVLCHEIAHFLLQHVEKSINKYVTAINSEEVQSQLRRIRGSEYRKNEQLNKLVKGLTFDSRRHSRDHEAEADSMGVELLRTTRFDLSGALSTLALLDVIDADTMNTTACLQKVFNSKDYPFQKKWVAKEEGLLGGHAKIENDELEDSLKTHPACKDRIRVLTPLVKGYSSSRGTSSASGYTSAKGASSANALKFIVDSSKFEKLKNIFRYETVEYAYVSDNYTRSLFLTLELLQANTMDAYLVTQVGRILNGIYSAQKAHTLSRVADLPSPDYRSNYNLLLQFIQNLYLENIAAINYHYLSAYHPQMDYYGPFKEAYNQSSRIVQQ